MPSRRRYMPRPGVPASAREVPEGGGIAFCLILSIVGAAAGLIVWLVSGSGMLAMVIYLATPSSGVALLIFFDAMTEPAPGRRAKLRPALRPRHLRPRYQNV